MRETELPCGLLIDTTLGECCLNRCQNSNISQEQDQKQKCRLIEACTYWQERKKRREAIERELTRISAEKLGPRKLRRWECGSSPPMA